MNTYAHLWKYQDDVSDKIVEKIKTRILFLVTFHGQLCHLWDNLVKYGRPIQATRENEVLLKKYAICMSVDYGENRDTHSYYLLFNTLQLINSLYILNCFTARLVTTENRSKDVSVITICLAKF